MKPITNKDLDLLKSLPEEQKNVYRQRRKPLLNALDIYDKNVSKGRITETETEKAEVDKWYNALLNLEEWAFDSIPEKVKKYI
jgi:hypothetical protein